jgi:hypothetical protein
MLRLPKVITELAPVGLLRRDADLAWQMLRDASQSAIVVVTLPEELPTNETLELAERIRRELSLSVGAVVLNRMLPILLEPEEQRRLAPLASLEAQQPGDAALRAAGDRAISEQVQIASRARLSELGVPVIELPDLEASGSTKTLLPTLAGLLRQA